MVPVESTGFWVLDMGVMAEINGASPTSIQLKDRTDFIVEDDTKYCKQPGGALN